MKFSYPHENHGFLTPNLHKWPSTQLTGRKEIYNNLLPTSNIKIFILTFDWMKWDLQKWLILIYFKSDKSVANFVSICQRSSHMETLQMTAVTLFLCWLFDNNVPSFGLFCSIKPCSFNLNTISTIRHSLDEEEIVVFGADSEIGT